MSCPNALLGKARQWLKISHHELDGELCDSIDAAKLDLGIAGVYEVHDALYTQAIRLYLYWQYNWQGDGEKWGADYFSLKCAMGLCPDYAQSEESQELGVRS